MSIYFQGVKGYTASRSEFSRPLCSLASQLETSAVVQESRGRATTTVSLHISTQQQLQGSRLPSDEANVCSLS